MHGINFNKTSSMIVPKNIPSDLKLSIFYTVSTENMQAIELYKQ
jgi:hypothetical protein